MSPQVLNTRENERLKTIHFESDGPTIQYGSKNNCFPLHNRIHQLSGFSVATWNLSNLAWKENSDGIDGLWNVQLTRVLRMTKTMKMIPPCTITLLGKLNIVHLFHSLYATLDNKMKPVSHTITVHQIISQEWDQQTISHIY